MSIKVKHILVKFEYEILDIEKKLNEGKAFEALAKSFSQCPSHKTGGDLGKIPRGRTMPEFEEAAFELKPGEVSKPTRSKFGWHLIYRYE